MSDVLPRRFLSNGVECVWAEDLDEAEAEVARLTAALVIAFVQGAQWWEYTSTSATMWASDRNRAEAEAVSKQKAGTLGVLAGEKEAGR